MSIPKATGINRLQGITNMTNREHKTGQREALDPISPDDNEEHTNFERYNG